MRVGCPQPGTTEGLERRYDAEHPTRRPTVAQDRASSSQKPRPSAIDQLKRTVVYQAPTDIPPATPWSRALVLGFDRPLPVESRVTWCVALHRLLAARIGEAAPSSVTGRYGDGELRPPNRVAIHALDASLARHLGLTTSAMVVLLPRGLESQDMARLTAALGGQLRLRSALGEGRLTLSKEVAADEFWAHPRHGSTRLWLPEPAMVSETRRQADDGGERWTLGHAALLSVGFVFKESFPAVAGKRAYWSLVREVRQRGVRAMNVRLVADSHVERYAYKFPNGAIAQPFTALIDLGELADDRTVLALGQARHVGGGLLMPVDVDERVAKELRA